MATHWFGSVHAVVSLLQLEAMGVTIPLLISWWFLQTRFPSSWANTCAYPNRWWYCAYWLSQLYVHNRVGQIFDISSEFLVCQDKVMNCVIFYHRHVGQAVEKIWHLLAHCIHGDWIIPTKFTGGEFVDVALLVKCFRPVILLGHPRVWYKVHSTITSPGSRVSDFPGKLCAQELKKAQIKRANIMGVQYNSRGSTGSGVNFVLLFLLLSICAKSHLLPLSVAATNRRCWCSPTLKYRVL